MMGKEENNDKLVEQILANVETMKFNAEEMRIWKNLPLAKKTFELIKQLGDDEGPEGRAAGCYMVLEKLSEYDAPRFALEMLRYTLEQLRLSESTDIDSDEVERRINDLERYIDIDNVSYDDYMNHSSRHLNFDPIERTPLWEEINYAIEAEIDDRLGDEPRGMGFCFGYWSEKRAVLAEHGIEWRDPHQLNRGVIFD